MAEKRKRKTPSIDGCSFTSSKEYLCAVFYTDDFQRDYGIYRWKLTGGRGGAEPETYFRLPADFVDKELYVGAFASVGSKIYMIGGRYKIKGPSRCSTDIFVVDTDKLHTKDPAQIVEKLPSVLRSQMTRRNAVVVGGKIYTFPDTFGYEEDCEASRFEVFDPVTKTTKSLPEPDFSEFGLPDSYAVIKSHILFCSDGECLIAFDTARESSRWIDLSADFLRMSIGIQEDRLLPFYPTLLNGACAATALGGDDDGSRFFATVSGVIPSNAVLKFEWPDRPFHGIVKIVDQPLRIAKWCRIYGIPKELVGKACFSHGGSVFFTYIEDDRPKCGTRVWIFKRYSLSYHSTEDEDYYSASQDFSVRVKHPCSYEYDALAPFVLQVPSSS